MVMEPTTIDFRLQRKAVRDILSNAPDGISRDELIRLAETKGIRGEDFQKVLTSLLNSGRTYYDERSGRFRIVRSE